VGEEVKRGEIWTVAGAGDYSGKPRPAVIIQDDRFSAIESITVCPFTTNSTSAQLFRVPVEPMEASGLVQASWLMVDKLATVPRTKLGHRVGYLDEGTILRLNRAITAFLGIAG
jgi:mRNA interferase MazF